ncbi:hypothetical protein BH18VER1_BH18VER1_03210 [soil metagenome]
MNKFLAMFALTVAEQRTVVVAMLMIVAFCAAKTYRDGAAAPDWAEISAQPSPSPGIRP